MSLLMDALKRAESAKVRNSGGSAGGSASSAVPPVPQARTVTLPELPSLAELDGQFDTQLRLTPQSADDPDPAGATPPAQAAEQAMAGNAFAAKRTNTRQRYQIALAMLLLALGAIASYFWWLTRMQTPAPMPALTRTVPPPAAAPPAVRGPAAALAERNDGTRDLTAAPSRNVFEPPAGTGRVAVAVLPPPPSSSDPATVRVSTFKPEVESDVALAYRQLLNGDLTASRAAYERALRQDSRQSDALYGLATINLREGKSVEAAGIFRHLLEMNRNDATALAGLVGLSTQGDPAPLESHVKSLLAAQGSNPVLHFALGNLYARQQRWSEAQQAYFDAMSGDADHPDYLFNLAVSLDQLHQDKLAARYYQLALEAAARRPAAFAMQEADVRLKQLRPLATSP